MTETQPQQIECRATKDPAVRLFIAAGMLLALGIYCFVDAFIRDMYPHKPFAEDMNAWMVWAFNYFGPFVFIPPGLALTIWGVMFLKRKCVADAEGISYAYCNKEKLPWSNVTRLDASQIKKGILDLYYNDDRKLRLDSWKLTNFKTLIAIVEQNVPKDKHEL